MENVVIDATNDDRVNMTIAVYTQAMEDIRDRRKVEWQTFAVVNAIYGLALKTLLSYSGAMTISSALLITILFTAFSWVWFIRIYGNGRRCGYPSAIRTDMQKAMREHTLKEIRPSQRQDKNGVDDGGWKWWRWSWPFWSYGGICFVITMYWLIFLGILWLGKTGFKAKEKEATLGQIKLDTFHLDDGLGLLTGAVILILLVVFFFFDRWVAKCRDDATCGVSEVENGTLSATEDDI